MESELMNSRPLMHPDEKPGFGSPALCLRDNSPAALNVIVDHANCLHGRVHSGRANEYEPTFLQGFAQRLRCR